MGWVSKLYGFPKTHQGERDYKREVIVAQADAVVQPTINPSHIHTALNPMNLQTPRCIWLLSAVVESIYRERIG
jgi:hypothetical protein